MKKAGFAVLGIIAVMFGLPFLAVTFAPGDAGMAICFVLFFGVNPMCSLFAGVFSGFQVRQRWYLPLVNGAVFVLSAWVLFTPGEPAFAIYGAAYLGIALLAMGITGYVLRGIRKNR